MNKFNIFALIVALFIAQNAFADSNNVSVGVNPFGIVKVTHKPNKDSELKLNYKPTMGFNVSYERQLSGLFLGVEVDYMHAKFDKINNDNISMSDALKFKDIDDFSAYFVGGHTFGSKNRLQLPFSLGVGLEYMSSSPQDDLYLGMEIKARCRYFISNQIALFGGTRARWGLSITSKSDGKPSDGLFRWELEAGILFAF